MRPIITVENLGKRYRIGEREPYRTIRDSFTRALAAPWRSVRARLAGQAGAPDAGHVWALSDVNFDVMPGTVLGVWNLVGISSQREMTAVSTAWIRAHGQAQFFGWFGTFVIGISVYTFP